LAARMARKTSATMREITPPNSVEATASSSLAAIG
jgi:hypothetical protein